jgi:hypothetical protein
MMRNLDTCKQEILRRAEARICKRRKRKKQLLGMGICAACFALCLGVLLTGRYEAPPQLEAKGQSAVKEGAMLDGHICDLPAADAPAAAAPTVGAGDEPADDWDCIVTETPAETQPQEIPDLLKGVPGETFTQYQGVYMQVDEEGLALLGTPVFLFRNQSGESAHLEDYDLARWDKEQWIDCAIDGEVRAEPMEIPSVSGEEAAAFGVSYREYDYSHPGLYRCTCTFRVGEDETPYTMWAEFTLEEPKLAVDALGEFGSDYPGIYLEFSNVFLEEGYIQAFWRNETELPARIYEGYDLQYLDGDNWVSCKKEYPQFGEDIYELAPWPSHVDVDYSISPELFDLSRAGEYRLTGQFWVEGGDVLYTAWAWFTLSMQKQ